MTVEQIELRKILNQMLADNGINRETLKDIVKECIDERIEKTLKMLAVQSDGEFAKMDERIQDILDRLVREEVKKQAREAIYHKVNQIFGTIRVNVELNNPTKREVINNDGE